MYQEKNFQVTDDMTQQEFNDQLIGLNYGDGEPEKIFSRIEKGSICIVKYNEENKIVAWLTQNKPIVGNEPNE